MLPPFDYFDHVRVCTRKQVQREYQIKSLPLIYHAEISIEDSAILSKPISELVHDVQSGSRDPVDILHLYGKIALRAHQKTNCLTEIMLQNAEVWIRDKTINLKGPLAGIPISLKDSVAVGGFDVSVGYSQKCGNPCIEDGPLVKVLKAAGAVPYVKTNLPITLLSFESANDVWGRCLNPHNPEYSPGGSTGGEAALLACGGRIGIGTDVAGSVRVPAHYSGIYSLKCSTGRWPKMGTRTSMPGQEGIPSVASPMARTLDDLSYFAAELLGMKCWKWDHSVHPIEWRGHLYQDAKEQSSCKVGVLRSDGVVKPSPACLRALDESVSALQDDGHQCLDIDPPVSPFQSLVLASQLLNSDGCRTFSSYFRTGERNDPGARQMLLYAKLPRTLKYLHYLYVKYIKRDSLWADLLYAWSEKSAYENWQLVAEREAHRARWHEWWTNQEYDFLLVPPSAIPAVPHHGMSSAVSACGYTFLFNLLDYTSGVLPVSKVDSKQDSLPESFEIRSLNGIAQGAYKLYDATKMHGLPVGVQVVGRRLEEERVLGFMQLLLDALAKHGKVYEPLDILS